MGCGNISRGKAPVWILATIPTVDNHVISLNLWLIAEINKSKTVL